MKRSKRESAERLFEVIGMIDDHIIAESQEPSALQRHNYARSLRARKFVSVCSVVAVVGACLYVGGMISKLSNKNEDVSFDGIDGKDESVGTAVPEYRNKLDRVLASAELSASTRRVSLDEIDFFDGKINLIWTDASTSTSGYYVLTLDESEERVKAGLKKGYSHISTDGGADRAGYAIWISYGNGEVVSPELKYSQGNVGYNELFEYSPEVVPGNAFVGIIEKNAE